MTQHEGTYFLGDSSAELVRLIQQDAHYTKVMGGLLPEQSDLSALHHVLDVACGPGGWAFELARAYPDIEVTGIDTNARMINYANAQARAGGLSDAHFSVASALGPLDFPDDSFDLVNARFIAGFMPVTAWPKVVQEFLRVVRSGGIIHIIDNEWGITSSPAYEQLFIITVRAFRAAGQSFSPDDRYYGISPMLSRFLQEAGCINIREIAHCLDFSAGTEAQLGTYQDTTIAFKLAQPFMVKMGVTTEEEFNQLYHQLTMEMLADDFHGIMYYLTVCGEKP